MSSDNVHKLFFYDWAKKRGESHVLSISMNVFYSYTIVP